MVCNCVLGAVCYVICVCCSEWLIRKFFVFIFYDQYKPETVEQNYYFISLLPVLKMLKGMSALCFYSVFLSI